MNLVKFEAHQKDLTSVYGVECHYEVWVNPADVSALAAHGDETRATIKGGLVYRLKGTLDDVLQKLGGPN